MINTSQLTYEPKQIVVALAFKDVAQMKAFTISRLNLFIRAATLLPKPAATIWRPFGYWMALYTVDL